MKIHFALLLFQQFRKKVIVIDRLVIISIYIISITKIIAWNEIKKYQLMQLWMRRRCNMANFIKREICFLMKNPITYVSVLLMVVIVVITVPPYLEPYAHVRTDSEPVEYDSDGDIDSGYIPTPIEEWYEVSLEEIKAGLINDVGLTIEQAESEISMMKDNAWDREKIVEYLREEYSLKGANSVFLLYEYKHATFSEMQQYLEESFKDQTFTKSFSYKYSEFLRLGSVLAAVILFVVLLSRDMKKDIYALLHTKPFMGSKYVLCKLISGASVIYMAIAVVTVVMNIIAVKTGNELGLGSNIFDVWKVVVIYNLPSIILTGCVVIFISLLFKNILPVVPAMLIYFIYSNMGADITMSGYIYILRPLGLFIRYTELFPNLSSPNGAVLNQGIICAVAVLLIFINSSLWERRRTI